MFFFNDTATTEIYTLSLHDALPIYGVLGQAAADRLGQLGGGGPLGQLSRGTVRERHTDVSHSKDRKSTRLNSSHANISYAVFCLKKKKTIREIRLINIHPNPASH